MIGSVIGDIVGSIYEFNNIKTKDFEFFQDSMEYTDDTVLTIATADWILNGGESWEYYARYANKYPHPKGAYGNGFAQWVHRTNFGDHIPYNSCGNGSAMRVGPVGWVFNQMASTLDAAKKSAAATHNHPEGLKGAAAVAFCIFMARKGFTKEAMREEIENWFDYNLHFTCDEIRPTYDWGSTCQDTVPQAIVSFIDANDFEDTIRNAISLGGDSDTLACIAGSIAEAYYGVPKAMYDKALTYLPEDLKSVLLEFDSKYGNKII